MCPTTTTVAEKIAENQRQARLKFAIGQGALERAKWRRKSESKARYGNKGPAEEEEAGPPLAAPSPARENRFLAKLEVFSAQTRGLEDDAEDGGGVDDESRSS